MPLTPRTRAPLVGPRFARGRTLLRRLLPGAVLLALLPAPAAAAASCSDFTNGTPSYTVRVCLTVPADGATLTGDTSITATVATVAGTNPGVQRVVFSLDGQYLLTDFTSPYTFTLPTSKFVDGPRVIGADALLRDGSTTAPDATIQTTFATGTTSPPVNPNTFVPKLANPPPNTSLVVGAVGDGAGGEPSAADAVHLISGWDPSLFLYLGDVYEKGSIAEYANWFGPSGSSSVYYGRLKGITDPTIGNHEYENGQAPGYFDYWDNVPHYYSFDSGNWHFISLDANSQFGQTAPGTPQYQWLQHDLQVNTKPCTLAYWHQPLFNIGQEPPATSMSDIWALLASRGVDLVVNGHDHDYQRWVPLDGTGAPSASGVTELVAGMGGHAHSRWTTTDSRVVASDNTHYGALRLDLNGAGAAYRFESTGGQVLDSGSVQCNATAIDTTAPTAPTGLLAVGTYKTSVSLSWGAGYDGVGVTGHQIFRDGQPLATVGPGTSYTDETVAAGSTHTYQVRAVDAAGNVSPASNTASATTPLNAVLFHDGFESGDFSQWTVASNLAIQSDNVFAGSLAAEATPAASPPPYAMRQLPAPEQNLYYATRFQVLDQPSGNINLLRFRAANGPTYSSLATFYVSATDRIGMRNDVTGTSTTSTAVAARGQWHTLQVHLVVNGTASQTEVWLDGTPVGALTASNVAFGVYTAIGQLELGAKATSSASYDVALDEVAYDRQPIGDATPPDEPGSFTATAHSGLRVDLAWTPSRDDIGTVAYDIYRNGQPIASVGAVTGYADTTVQPLTTFTYAVVARDAAGNVSAPSPTLSVTTPDVFVDGFESGDLSHWTSSSGVAVQSAVVDTGNDAAEATSDGTAGASAAATLDAGAQELYYRARFDVLGRGANSVSLLRLRDAGNGAIASAFISSTGKLGLRNDATALTTTTAVTVTPGWHELQLHVDTDPAAPLAELYYDGQLVASRSDGLGPNRIGRLELGDPSVGRAFDVAFDGVVVDPGFIADLAPPTAPGSLQATAASAQEVDLAWTAATDDVGVTGYRIYRNGLALGTVDGTTLAYADTMVTDATHYTYVVTALDAAGHESPLTATADATTPDGTPPSAPTGLAATAVPGQNRIDLTWAAATDNLAVTGYAIYRDGGATALATVGGGSTAYSDTAVTSVSTHAYTVRALDAAGNVSAASSAATATSADTAPPALVGAPTVTTVDDGRLTVAFAPTTDDVAVASYRIYRDGLSTALTTLPAGTTTYTDTGLQPGHTYAYAVSAVDTSGNASAPGPSGSGATAPDATPPTAPTGLSAVAVPDQNRIDLTWAASTDNLAVTGYAVYRDGGATALATVGGGSTGYSDTAVTSVSTHSYTVRALDAAGNVSAPSSAATATSADTAPPALVGAPTVTTLDDGRLTVAFTATTDDVAVASYRIYRDGSATALTTLPAGTTTYTDTGLQPGRTYAYTVSAVDTSGNASAPGPSGSGATALFTDGFETGSLTRWTSNSGLVVQRRTVFAGTFAAESQSPNKALAFASKTLPAAVTGVWMRERIQIPKGKLAVTDVLRLRTAAGGNLLALFYDGNGRLGVLNDTRGTSRTSATVVTQNAWHQVAIHLVVQGTTSTVEVYLDGTRLNDLSTTDAYGTTPVGQVVAGESTAGRSYDTLIDDVSVDTK